MSSTTIGSRRDRAPATAGASRERRRARRPPPRERARKKRQALELGVLDGHLGYFVRRLQVWIFQDFVRTLASFDIRPAQYSVLVVIEANPGLSQADLADTLGIERARLVRLLDGLEKRGLTRRQPSPIDRRSHALFLTREGQQKSQAHQGAGGRARGEPGKAAGPREARGDARGPARLALRFREARFE